MSDYIICEKCKKEKYKHCIEPHSLTCYECLNLDKEDIINKPNHYHAGGVDVVSFCKGKVSNEQMKGFYRVNVIKYVGRYELKNGIEDLKKAQWNLNQLIESERKETE